MSPAHVLCNKVKDCMTCKTVNQVLSEVSTKIVGSKIFPYDILSKY